MPGEGLQTPVTPSTQLRQLLGEVERALLLITGQRRYKSQYARLRRQRDQLEELFDRLQIERLRDAAVDFGQDVERLKKITTDLEAATKRAAKTKEILGYITAAVEVVAQVLRLVLAFV